MNYNDSRPLSLDDINSGLSTAKMKSAIIFITLRRDTCLIPSANRQEQGTPKHKAD